MFKFDFTTRNIDVIYKLEITLKLVSFFIKIANTKVFYILHKRKNLSMRIHWRTW